MGVQQLLAKVLEASGRPMTDLTEYARIVVSSSPSLQQSPPQPPTAAAAASSSSNQEQQQHQQQSGHSRQSRQRRRRLRIGVDIGTWIHRASQGKGDMLADERYLDNYGRAELLQQQQQQQQRQGMEDQQQQQEQDQQLLQQQEQEQQRIEKEQREHLYIQACTKYVLDRLLLLQRGGNGNSNVSDNTDSSNKDDEALFSILVVLDGSTPPIKRPLVKDRSGKRNQAIQQRDEDVVVATAAAAEAAAGTNENVEDAAAAATADALLLERRLKGFRRGGAGELFGDIVDCVIHAMRINKICFMVAPYEADGQLAFLASQGLIDLIVTEDSDLILASYAARRRDNNNNSTTPGHGACPILYKLIDSLQPSAGGSSNTNNDSNSNSNNNNNNNNKLRGVLIRSSDLSSQKVATTILNEKRKGLINLADFTPAMMAVLFVAAGCDYSTKLAGIGIGTACTIVRDAFLNTNNNNKTKKKQDKSPSPLERVFAGIYEEAYNKEKEKLKDPEFKKAFERNFLGALLMFRHPTVYDPILGRCRSMNLNDGENDNDQNSSTSGDGGGGGDAELLLYKPYAQLVQNAKARQAFTGSLITPPQLATFMAEGWVSPRTNKLRSTYTIKQSTISTTATTAATTANAYLPDHVRIWVERNFPQALGSLPPPTRTNYEEENEVVDNEENLVGNHQASVATAFVVRAAANDNDETMNDDDFATQQPEQQPLSPIDDAALVSSPPPHALPPKRSIVDEIQDIESSDNLDGTPTKRPRSTMQQEPPEDNTVMMVDCADSVDDDVAHLETQYDDSNDI